MAHLSLCPTCCLCFPLADPHQEPEHKESAVCPVLPQCGSQSSSTSVTWELVGNARSWVPPKPPESKAVSQSSPGDKVGPSCLRTSDLVHKGQSPGLENQVPVRFLGLFSPNSTQAPELSWTQVLDVSQAVPKLVSVPPFTSFMTFHKGTSSF